METVWRQFNQYARVTQILSSSKRQILLAAKLDEDGAEFISHLWELSASASDWQQITTGISVSSPALAPDGTLYYLQASASGEPLDLWRQIPGAEPELWAKHPGGFLKVQASNQTVLATANVLPAASGDLQREAELRAERKTRKIDAILQTGMPVQHWDSDLAGYTHIYRVDPPVNEGLASLVDLLPEVTTELREASWHLSAGGQRAVLTWCVTTARGVNRSHLAILHLDKALQINSDNLNSVNPLTAQMVATSRTLQLVALAAEGPQTSDISQSSLGSPSSTSFAYDWFRAAISPNGRYVAVTKAIHGTASEPDDNQLWVLDLAKISDLISADSLPPITQYGWRLADKLDRWPNSPVWIADNQTLIFGADHFGQAPLFKVNINHPEQVVRLTAQGAFSSVTPRNPLEVDATEAEILTICSTYAFPPEVRLISTAAQVDMELGSASKIVDIEIVKAQEDQEISANFLKIPAFAPRPNLAGRLEEIWVPVKEEPGLRGKENSSVTQIRATVLWPEKASPQNPVPLLVWVHGGPLSSWNAWSWRWNPWIYVAQGYAVVLPDPALSTGYGRAHICRGYGQWGGATFRDVMAVTDVLEQHPAIDSTRIAAMGGSFGGYSMNWIAGHTNRFRCIVSHASLYRMSAFLGTTDYPAYWERELTEKHCQEYSPHLAAAQISTPMLVIHGRKDYRVPFTQSLDLWWDLLHKSALPADATGRSPHRLLVFPTNHHWVLNPGNSEIWYQSTLAFLAENGMAPDPQTAPGYPPELA